MIGPTAHDAAGEPIEQPKPGHHAEQRERDGEHYDDGNRERTRLGDEDHVDHRERRGEGDAEIAEHIERDLPLPFAREAHADSGRHVPGNPTAWRKIRRMTARGRDRGAAVGHDVHHALGRRPARAVGRDVDEPLEVLVVDRLIDPPLGEGAEFGEGHEAAGLGPHRHLSEIGRGLRG